VKRVVMDGQASSGTGASGLTGTADIADPTDISEPGGPVTRIRRLGGVLSGAAVGIAKVLVLVWRVSPALTVALAGTTIGMGLVPTASAWLLRMLVDSLAGQGKAGGPGLFGLGLDRTGTVVVLAGLQLAVLLFNAGCGGVRNLAQQLLQERTFQVVQFRVMRHAADLELAFFEDSRSYDLLRQAQKEASSRSVTMITGVFAMVQSAITVVSMSAVLVGLSPWLALLTLLAPIPAFIADSRYGLRNFFLLLWAAPTRRRMDYLANLVTTDTAAKEVKLFGLNGFFADRFALLGQAFYQRLRRLVSTRYLVGAAWVSLTALGSGALFLYAGLQTASGHMSIGDLTLYITATTSVSASLQGMLLGISGAYESGLFLRNLEDLLSRPSRIRSPERPRPLPGVVRGRVVFEGVSFRYPGTAGWALTDVNVEIGPGEKVAIVGRNGAGKSTMIKLLCRLYDPAHGRILLDGVDIKELDLAELRSCIGAMFQDHVAYQASALENIGLGDVARIEDRDAVRNAAERAGVAELIELLPRGYDTPLGRWFDQGAQLSGGEWQKVALARAFMRDVPLLLLDEPTAALDARTEYDLFARLRVLSAGRTTLYVSHRFSTVRQADRILFLDGGRVSEEGTHAELMLREGAYASLFTLQASAYTGEAVAGRESEGR
jgi:ATP-binding cassette, subfamily B, bacterial